MRKLALEYLRDTVRELPDKTAIHDRGASVSYAELWQRAVPLAAGIRAVMASRSLPVVVDIEKSISAIVGIVAAQLAGAIYVPIDPTTPPQRRARMLERLGPHVVLDARDGAFRLDGRSVDSFTDEARRWDRMEAELLEALTSRNSHDPLYVMFTSGTTGTPKGVTIANISVIDFIDWVAATYEVGPDEAIGSQAPLYFDNSVLDLYLSFARGCTLHLIPRECFRFPGTLVDFLEQQRITLVFFVPAVLAHLSSLDLLRDFDTSWLRKVLFAGEPMPLSTVRYLRRYLPDALLSNLYGPTEITDIAIYHIFGDELDQLERTPIGLPCRNTRIVLLDEQGRPVEQADTVGEICVGGLGVSLGYWNDPDATADAFVQDPAHQRYRDILYRTGDLGLRASRDGLIYLLGRRDHQFKHLGHRIEPGEIEAALVRHGPVGQCCVRYDQERQEIVAFLAAADLPAVEGLQDRLGAALPAYMLPRRFVTVKRFPLTPNGKIDRRALWSAYEAGEL